MIVLITGVTGFAGSHLADYLLDRNDVKIIGIYRQRSRMENVMHLAKDIELRECDLRDPSSTCKLISSVKPEWIFHLAAQSFVPTSWQAPYESMETNLMGQLNLFEAVLKCKLSPRIQIACSSEEYGLVHPDEVPITEENPLRPLSPYAVSKIGQDYLGYQYYRSYGLDVIRTRAFNHTGPRQGDPFVVSNFARQVAEIEAGQKPPVIQVGNLEAKRDFTDVRDVVRAYCLALEHAEPGAVYNIASGRTYSIREILDRLIAWSRVPVDIEVDSNRLRPSDVPILLGDASVFQSKTGWQTRIPLEKTLQDTLNYWRGRVGSI